MSEKTAQVPVIDWTTERSADERINPPKVYEHIQRGDQPMQRVRIWNGSEPWLITKHAEYRQLAIDRRFSSDITARGFPLKNEGYQSKRRTLVVMDDPDHLQLRRVWAKNLSVKRMEAYRPAMQRIVDELIDAMLAGPKPVDLVSAFALPVPALVLGEVFGIPAEDRQMFLDLASTLSSATSTKQDTARVMAELRAYADKLVAVREAEPGDDVISKFLEDGVRTGVMTREELVDEVALQSAAGHDTSMGMISLATLALLRHPDQLALLQENSDDPTFIANATEELLRFISPTQTGRRRVATEDVEIGGHLIKAGEGVVALDHQSSRDPDVFPDPDKLDLQRPEARLHHALGYGMHQCAGQSLARVELQVVFSTLYRRIPTLKLAVPEEELPFREDTIVYILDAMPVTW